MRSRCGSVVLHPWPFPLLVPSTPQGPHYPTLGVANASSVPLATSLPTHNALSFSLCRYRHPTGILKSALQGTFALEELQNRKDCKLGLYFGMPFFFKGHVERADLKLTIKSETGFELLNLPLPPRYQGYFFGRCRGTGSHYVAQNIFDLAIVLPWLPKFQCCGCVLIYSAQKVIYLFTYQHTMGQNRL